MNTISIQGLGLMGASLGLALKARTDLRVLGYARRRETRDAALERRVVDEVFDHPAGAARGAGIVVLCTPILSIPALVRDLVPALQPGAIVTDVGSTKAWLEAQVPPILAEARTGARWIGSHPMCGSEQTGHEAACPDLYEGSTVVVCAGDSDPIDELWRAAGAEVLRLDSATHDQLVARTSHLPHLAAAALALAADGVEHPDRDRLKGSGYEDTTRVAAGSPELWHDIVKTNAAPVAEALRDLRTEIDRAVRHIEAADFDGLREVLQRAATHRAR